MPKGDCYAANGRWMIGKKNYQLVHGVAILASDGKPFGHCWIEYGNMVSLILLMVEILNYLKKDIMNWVGYQLQDIRIINMIQHKWELK